MKAEYCGSIRDCFQELLENENYVSKSPFDSKNKYLQKYMVLKCSGTIENIFKHIIFDKVVDGATSIVFGYFETILLKRTFNPKYDNICRLLKEINELWSKSFKAYFPKSEMTARHLEDLIENRNRIAHGVNITVPSIIDTKTQFISSCKMLVWMDRNL